MDHFIFQTITLIHKHLNILNN